MTDLKQFIKQEAVAIIAFIAAIISCIFVPVTNYVSYIDTDLIGVMFGFMAVVAGFSVNNVFKVLSEQVAALAKDTRNLALALVFMVLFMSMLITNDVALIAFIPFTVMMYEKIDKSPVYVIVLQTVAANMGSAFTPFGNPQNLYLFSASKMTSSEFFSLTLPVTAVSMLMLFIGCMMIKKEPIFLEKDEQKATVQNPKYLLLYAALFILCILSVFNVVDTISVFASVCVVVAIIQPSVFVKVDYGLLATFACFFIFVGNVKNIPEVTQFISSVISGHEFESSVLCSQIISNVPASVMLSAFTDDYKSLILGTDIGGLGTLIASLASLISYKSYLRSEKSDSKKFINCFTIVNIIFLAVLVPMAKFVILK